MNSLQEIFTKLEPDNFIKKALLTTLLEKAGRDSTGAFGMGWEPNLAKEINGVLKESGTNLRIYNTILCEKYLSEEQKEKFKTKNGSTLLKVLESLKKKKKQTFVDYSAADYFILNFSTFEVEQMSSIKTKSSVNGDIFINNDPNGDIFKLVSEMLNPSINRLTDEALSLKKLNFPTSSIGTVFCFQITETAEHKFIVKCFFFDDSLWPKLSSILDDKENYRFSYNPNEDFIIETKTQSNKFEYFVKITNRNKTKKKSSTSHDRGIKVNEKFIDKFFTHFYTTSEIDLTDLPKQVDEFYNL